LIFKEESYLDKVNDISNGSYYIETLTNELATKAWEEFKQIEKAGGFIASILNGNIKAKIEEQAFNLVNEYKEGKRTLIGVNKFPNANDKPEKLADTTKNKGLNKLSLTAALV
jgi:methylmalonyl-CoA mutase